MSVQAITWALGVTTRSATHKAVLLVLANYADEDGLCWPSQERIAREACCSDRTVRRVLLDFELDSVLTRATRRRADGTHASDRLMLAVQAVQPAAKVSGGLSGGQFDRRPNCPVDGPPDKVASGQIDQRSDWPQPPDRLSAHIRPPKGGSLEPPLEPPLVEVEARAPGVPASKAQLDAVMAQLFAAAGPGLADPAREAGLHRTASFVISWLTQGCSLELDVLPIVQALTAKARADPITTWGYFDRAVRKARDVRLADPSAHLSPHSLAPSSQEHTHAHAAGPRPPSYGLAASVAHADAVRRRGAARALAELGELDAGGALAAGSDG